MTVPQRAALYLRISTARQAEHDVSIPIRSAEAKPIAPRAATSSSKPYVEPGASATNDRRPEFQRMIEAGTSKPAPFDVVIVHSFSRFFRDAFDMEFYVRKLAKNGVKLLSITQEIGDDPVHQMVRQIMALFDEYQSKENAKHVIPALKENPSSPGSGRRSVTPGPSLGRRDASIRRKAPLKKSSCTSCWPTLRSSSATRSRARTSSAGSSGGGTRSRSPEGSSGGFVDRARLPSPSPWRSRSVRITACRSLVLTASTTSPSSRSGGCAWASPSSESSLGTRSKTAATNACIRHSNRKRPVLPE